MINREAKPRCFRGVDIRALPRTYFSNPEAWMTTKVFTGWVRALHLKMYGRKNLLLIDNAPGHADIELKTSTSTFCPRIRLPIYNQWMLALFGISNSTTKKRFVQWVVNQCGSEKRLDLLSSIKFVVDAWNAVSGTTIRHCWRHTRIVPESMSATLEQHTEPSRVGIPRGAHI